MMGVMHKGIGRESSHKPMKAVEGDVEVAWYCHKGTSLGTRPLSKLGFIYMEVWELPPVSSFSQLPLSYCNRPRA